MKQGKEVLYATTAQGLDLIARYRAVREACLVDGFAAFDGVNNAALGEVQGNYACYLGSMIRPREVRQICDHTWPAGWRLLHKRPVLGHGDLPAFR